jgi:hypothetical protein
MPGLSLVSPDHIEQRAEKAFSLAHGRDVAA